MIILFEPATFDLLPKIIAEANILLCGDYLISTLIAPSKELAGTAMFENRASDRYTVLLELAYAPKALFMFAADEQIHPTYWQIAEALF